MLWRKGSKPSFARPFNNVWVPINVLPNVVVSLPLPSPVSEETGSPSDDVKPNHSGIPHLSPHRFFSYRDYNRRLVFLSSLMSQGKFFIVFLSKYKTKNLVRMLLLMSEFSPSVLSLDVGHVLSEWKAKVLLFVQKKTRASLVVQTSSDSSLYKG
jgi:hypothetical protein